MKPILIIKAGTTFPSLKSTVGDFDDWIISGTGKPRNAFIVSPVYENVPLPQPDYISALIISGSHENVTDNLPWMEKTSQWLHKAAAKQIPVLGICFGHQLLAHTFGGMVGFNPAGWELGNVRIRLNKPAEKDPLFSVLPLSFIVHASHAQTVLQLPPEAVALANSEMDKYHTFRLGKNIWGVQFHPEFNCQITKTYISHHKKELLAGNQNPAALSALCKESGEGALLLKQFVKIVENS